MFLGQLYYFDKELGRIQQPLVLSDLDGIEIAGIGKINIAEYDSFELDDWRTDLRDKFIQGYQNILTENKLEFASIWWAIATSAAKITNELPTVKSVFETELLNWGKNGYSTEKLQNLLNTGRLSVNQADFALYYGLHVLDILSGETGSFAGNFEINEFSTDVETSDSLSVEPQILVLSGNYLKPLFVNLNCEFLPKASSETLILDQILNNSRKNSKLELVLIENLSLDLQYFLLKRLPPELIVSSLDLSDANQESYFDQIVKKTLGINLN